MKLHTVIHIGILTTLMWCKAGLGQVQNRQMIQLTDSDTLRLQYIQVEFGTALVDDDSLTVTFHIDLQQNKIVSPDETLTLTPVLMDDRHCLEIAPILVNGHNRRKYYKRERVLDYNHCLLLPDTVINLPKGLTKCSEPLSIDYRYRLPFTSWMGGASFYLRVTGRECCDEYPLGNMMLCADLHQSPHVYTDTLYVFRDTCMYREIEQPKSISARLLNDKSGQTPFVQQKFFPATFSVDDTSVTFRLWFRQNEGQVRPDLYDNNKQIEHMKSVLEILGDRLREVKVTSCSSPEGMYVLNEELARSRGRIVVYYLLDELPSLPTGKIKLSERPENWEGLEWLLEHGDKDYREEALHIIHTVPIFLSRETRLMELHAGTPYRNMLKELFPLLRYADITFVYEENENKLMQGGEDKP